MANPFLGEIRLFSLGYAPKGWAQCNGQLLPINQNQALFSLLGTTYGGDGRTTFALPDLRGRVPVHAGPGITLGEVGGEEAHTLLESEMPSHTHLARATTKEADSDDPNNVYWASLTVSGYSYNPPNVTMSPQALAVAGGSRPHENRQPYTVVNYCIALLGIFPSPN
ncbi:phage tail protein [Paenibacillus sedimenti]|uniref:Phage tail protein n=1 Tax=Paenibacillus sedimenti TaxID=2770274 RepID=A0A926KTP4_9BACL|nr:tail fiber protein [Paenibacillus sedimenti]MBD0381959.1 phage tail protein [Paenibacillus sedimenti]